MKVDFYIDGGKTFLKTREMSEVPRKGDIVFDGKTRYIVAYIDFNISNTLVGITVILE